MSGYVLAYRGGDGLTGSSILQADPLAATRELARGCLLVASRDRVAVHEPIDMDGM